jgi:hypothetical protein
MFSVFSWEFHMTQFAELNNLLSWEVVMRDHLPAPAYALWIGLRSGASSSILAEIAAR